MCIEERIIEYRDLGRMDYIEAWKIQRLLFDRKVENKKQGIRSEDYILAVEHPAVVTLGRHADKNNLLVSKCFLEAKDISVFEIERGGDITYHAVGQLVIYPIIDLERYRLGVKDYVRLLEEAVIITLGEYGITGERIEGASGVWIGKGTEMERKICALGVKCSRFCTMHGLALNINTDLNGFSIINPCGFVDKGVTSMSCETGRDLDFEEVKGKLVGIFKSLLEFRIPSRETL